MLYTVISSGLIVLSLESGDAWGKLRKKVLKKNSRGHGPPPGLATLTLYLSGTLSPAWCPRRSWPQSSFLGQQRWLVPQLGPLYFQRVLTLISSPVPGRLPNIKPGGSPQGCAG